MTAVLRRFSGRLGAVSLGLVLASLPFVHFGTGAGHGHAAGAHSDHTSYHGGVLRMIGDHHVEIVASDRDVRAFVSDAWRRPLRPQHAEARFGSGVRTMTWHTDHFEVSFEHADSGAPDRLLGVTIALTETSELDVALPPLLRPEGHRLVDVSQKRVARDSRPRTY